MAGQDYDHLQEEADAPDEASNDTDEPEFDDETLRSNEQRSRFFFAAMSFLVALLFLSAYLNHLTGLSSTILLLGMLAFTAIGIFLLLGGVSAGSKNLPSSKDLQEETVQFGIKRGFLRREQSEKHSGGGVGDKQEVDGAPLSLTPFELLVQEALASIPAEFHERMNNVHVQVEYTPDEELLRRVGTRAGYTLLGLYEGIPLTTYGRLHSSYPETITIFQRNIERYCHGDPDRIREQVLHTILHEVAHHFGIDHDEMPIWIK